MTSGAPVKATSASFQSYQNISTAKPITAVMQTSPTRTVWRIGVRPSESGKSGVLRPSNTNLVSLFLMANLPLRQLGEPGTSASLSLNFHFSFGSF